MRKTETKSVGFSKIGFMIAIIGSSLGLGSMWRFPTLMAQSGGAAFLIPFTISMVICAIPLLMFEMNIGNKFKQVQTDLFHGFYGKKGRFFGYFYPMLAFLISSFYVIIIGWILLQIIISFTSNLLVDNYLFDQLLKPPQGINQISDIGAPNLILIGALLFIFAFVGIISLLGLKSGLERLNKLLIPILLVVLIFLMIYCMTLDGASIGLNKMWQPDWQSLKQPKVWTNAFSQSFFSLSLAMGTIIYFSSKTKNFQDNNNSAFLMALPLILISILAGMMNFSALGFLAKQSGKSIEEIIGTTPDPGLIFKEFPRVFIKIGQDTSVIFSHILSILFYFCLFSAGTMTLIALIEVVCGNFRVTSKLGRKTHTLLWIGLLFLTSIIFTTSGGKFLINGVDIWLNNIWLFVIAIGEILILVLAFKDRKLQINPKWKELMITSNQHSWIKLGSKYTKFLLGTIPLLLIMVAFNFYELFGVIIWDSQSIIPYFAFGVPIGLGAQILIPFIFTYHYKLKKIFIGKKREVKI